MIRGSRALATALLRRAHGRRGPARAVTVEVDAKPPAEVGRAVTFSARATGSGAITYTWNFGDGTITEASAEPAASHVYAEPGHYAVIVIARDQTGPRSASFLQTIHRPTTVASPTASSTIVHDAARHRVCNVNADNDSVSCIDTERLERTFEAPAGAHPRTLAIAADGAIWVANQDDGTLSVLDPDGSPRRTIELGVAAAPFGVVTNPARDKVFVTLQGPGEVVAFDAASGGELARGKAGNMPAGIAVSADGSRVLVTSLISPQDRGEVHELDGTTLGERPRSRAGARPRTGRGRGQPRRAELPATGGDLTGRRERDRALEEGQRVARRRPRRPGPHVRDLGAHDRVAARSRRTTSSFWINVSTSTTARSASPRPSARSATTSSWRCSAAAGSPWSTPTTATRLAAC